MSYELGTELDQPAARIEETVGSLPTVDVVRRCARSLVDRWLLEDEVAWPIVSRELEEYGRPYNGVPSTLVGRIVNSEPIAETVCARLFVRGLTSKGEPPWAAQEPPWWESQAYGEDYTADQVSELMARLRQLLMVDDDAWEPATGSSWVWWPTNTPVRIDVAPPRRVLGDASYRISARCRIVEDVGAVEDEVLEYLAAVNAYATSFPVVYLPEERAVELRLAYTAHAGNETLLQFVSGAILLLTAGSRRAGIVAEGVSGIAFRRANPVWGWREKEDELLTFFDRTDRPGAVEGRFVSDTEELVLPAEAGSVLQMPADSVGVCQSELAFIHDVPAVLSGPDLPLGTSLFKMDATIHRDDIGPGLLLTLRLPVCPAQPARLANALNLLETSEPTGFSCFGAWCVEPNDANSLAFAQFVPNDYYTPGLAVVLSSAFLSRNRWAAEQCGLGDSPQA
jgi:hypothetical protein